MPLVPDRSQENYWTCFGAENAILSGRWEKLAPLDRLRSRLWKSLNAGVGLSHFSKARPKLFESKRPKYAPFNRRPGRGREKLMAARRRTQASAAYGQA